MSQPTHEELVKAIAVLSAIVANREVLAPLSKEERQALMEASGRLSRPLRHDAKKERQAVARERRLEREALDRVARAGTAIRQARQATVYSAPQIAIAPPADARPERILATPKSCYVCKQPYIRLHFFYDALCPDCGEYNWQKRFQTADLSGRVVVITGARVKIGHHAALMCLRAGATVITTTRFPRDAATRFATQPDFAEFSPRLHVHGLDLRHPPSVEIFARYVDARFPQVDLLINNAAQTVRRPTGFYKHLLEAERADWHDVPAALRDTLATHEDLKARIGAPSESGDGLFSTGLAPFGGGPGIGIADSANLSQVPCTWDDHTSGLDVFPSGKLDADLQQVDTRTRNTWRMTLHEVPTPELLEVQLINAISPYILCARLKPAMLRNNTNDRHIVNVSAMEGIFSRGTKTDKHPHTNMAKAALNMMTLTGAADYRQDNLYMNAVDTGWVTDEDPAPDVARKQAVHDFQPPLDIVDGAARILDPFFVGLNTGEHMSGKFLKDYKPSAW